MFLPAPTLTVPFRVPCRLTLRLTADHLAPLAGNPAVEGCGFLVGTSDALTAVWPVPSLNPQPDSYAIGRCAWQAAHRRARAEGLRVWGTVHTHPHGPSGPSDRDYEIADRLPAHELRAVWHPDSGLFTVYHRSGTLLTRVIQRAWTVRVGA